MPNICSKIKVFCVNLYNKLFVKKVKVMFFGLENSGKTTLMTRLFEGRYDPNTPTSQNVRLYRYEMDGIVFFVYDIPGNTSSRSKWDHYYKKSDIIVFFIDGLCDDEACAQSREELKSLIYRNMWIKKSLLVIGTKNDEPKALLCRDIILRLDLVSIVDREIACYSVSSLKDTNIDLVKSWLLDQVD